MVQYLAKKKKPKLYFCVGVSKSTCNEVSKPSGQSLFFFDVELLEKTKLTLFFYLQFSKNSCKVTVGPKGQNWRSETADRSRGQT